MKPLWIFHGLIVAAFAILASRVGADVKMPAIFGDHMVLQQEMNLPIWGTADIGEKVTVTVASATGTATTSDNGKWMVKLPPLPSASAPVTVSVSGKNTLKFQDVLIGDVWVCSGQSNMAMTAVQREASDPQLRFFIVPIQTTIHPAENVKGTWMACTPETAGKFSAVGYYFARELRSALKRPVGMIGAYASGSAANPWVSIEGLRKEPTLKCYVDNYESVLAEFPRRQAQYAENLTEYQASLAKWEKEHGPAYRTIHQQWYDAISKAQRAGEPAPPKPKTMPPEPPAAPFTPEGGPRTPSTLFNGMIAPLIPFGIKGAVWYQGESNHARPLEYKTLLARLITDWREQWGEGDFPFLVVQLPNFKAPAEDWPYVRESQLKATQSVPHAGIAITIDVGDPNDLHPRNKVHVGARLALAARHVAYGEDLVYCGPIFESMKVEGNVIRVNFTHTGGGLAIGAAPYLPARVQALPVTSLEGFLIAGEDKKWIKADARIDGSSVLVSSSQVPNPIAVRYAWENAPRCNLYNKEHLPASPFRTDDWKPDLRLDDFNVWPGAKFPKKK